MTMIITIIITMMIIIIIITMIIITIIIKNFEELRNWGIVTENYLKLFLNY